MHFLHACVCVNYIDNRERGKQVVHTHTTAPLLQEALWYSLNQQYTALIFQ